MQINNDNQLAAAIGTINNILSHNLEPKSIKIMGDIADGIHTYLHDNRIELGSYSDTVAQIISKLCDIEDDAIYNIYETLDECVGYSVDDDGDEYGDQKYHELKESTLPNGR